MRGEGTPPLLDLPGPGHKHGGAPWQTTIKSKKIEENRKRSLIRSCPFSNPPYSSPWTNLDGECECQKHRCFSIFQADTNFLYFSEKNEARKTRSEMGPPNRHKMGPFWEGFWDPPKWGPHFWGLGRTSSDP